MEICNIHQLTLDNFFLASRSSTETTHAYSVYKPQQDIKYQPQVLVQSPVLYTHALYTHAAQPT